MSAASRSTLKTDVITGGVVNAELRTSTNSNHAALDNNMFLTLLTSVIFHA